MKLKEKTKKIVVALFTLNFFIVYFLYFPSINFTKNDQCQNSYFNLIKKEKAIISSDKEYFYIRRGTKIEKIFKNSTITCDLNKALSRGINQSVIAYSLYGTNQRYFRLLETILIQAREFYKNYTIRIYHDSSLNSSLISKFECYYDNVDFCNVEYTPLNNSIMNNKDKFHNLSFIPPKSWRFVALGDDLIDTVLWRDIDSLFTQREIDSVNEWLWSNKFGHIMRNHPAHGTLILAGMWGLKLSQNRLLANQFFTKLQDKTMAPNFLKSGVARKWLDQQYLAVHVYKYIKNISVIHDSYLCKIYKDSTPFPTRRYGNCFVATQSANCSAIKMLPPCPSECRPKNHQDWDRC